MSSTRLPGKVLMEVMDRSLLSYQIERLWFCKKIDEIIIATTMNAEDDPIAFLAQEEGLKCYRGSEDDVLDRYYKTAKKYNVKHIMRITGDCPFIDPDICDHVAEKYFQVDADYAVTGRSFAEGLDCEILSFRALERSWKEAQCKSEREHVTLYIRNHSKEFKSVTIENETDDSKYRITLDEPEDFPVVKAILENFYKDKDHCFTVEEIKSFLDSHPEIYRLNAHIIRNEGTLRSIKEYEYGCKPQR